MERSGYLISQPKGYKAFIPKPLPPHPPINLGEIPLLIEAQEALTRLDGLAKALPNTGHLTAMSIRKEALLSSQIEGTQASLEDLFNYESHCALPNLSDVEEVVCYIKALNHGLRRLKDFPMSIRLIKEIHQILLEGDRHKTPGNFRRSQNWIGFPGSTLATAAFIPPPPEEAKKAMGDLELFLHKTEGIPPLIASALIHYQFETIHPFLDGNGRLGRLLITFFLCWKGLLSKPLLYLSYYFKMHRQEYYDRLTWVRRKGNFEQWVSFFLEGVKRTCDMALDSGSQIIALQAKHRKHLNSKNAFLFLDWLYEKPLFSIKELSQALNLSYQGAKLLVNEFEKLRLLEETTGQRRNKRYAYSEYLNILIEGTRI